MLMSSKAHFPQNLSEELMMDCSFWRTSEPKFLFRGKQFN